MAGVVVTFAVDSGGGSISAASVTSGSDGVATLDRWTLGTMPGRQVLRASVPDVAPLRLVALAVFRDVPVVSETPIGVRGGDVRVDAPGERLDGLLISVPDSSYPTETRWNITELRGRTVPLPAEAFVAGPMLRISNGAGASARVLSLRIPVRAGRDTALTAFYYDSATGLMEAIPTLERTDSTFTVMMRHVSADQMLGPTVPAQGRGAVAQLPFGQVVVVVVGVRPGLLRSTVGSTFRPGVDDWDFPNEGSYLSPGGICTGMQVAALYYHYRYRGSRGVLHRQFDRIAADPRDNPLGVLLSSRIQEAGDWDRLWAGIRQRDAQAQRAGWPADVLNYHTLVVSLYATGRPQLLAVFPASGPGHMLVAYGVSNGVVQLSDPNTPGVTGATIQYNPASLTFSPFTFPIRAGTPPLRMGKIFVAGVSAMIPVSQVDALWSQALATRQSPVPFVATTREYWNDLERRWYPLANRVVVPSDSLMTRSLCPTCPVQRTTRVPERVFVQVFDTAGAFIGRDNSAVSEGTIVRLRRGTQPLGFFEVGYAPRDSSASYMNYTWADVVSTGAQVTPRGVGVVRDSTQRFTVQHGNSLPAGAELLWTFRLGNAVDSVLVRGDTTVSYRFRNPGGHVVRVDVRSGGVLVGRDSTTVEVGSLALSPAVYSVEPDSTATLTATFPGGFPSGTRFQWDLGDGRTLTTTTPTLRAVYPRGTTVPRSHPVTVEVRNGATLIGQASATVVVEVLRGVWQFTQVVAQTRSGSFGLVERLIAAPSNWFLYLLHTTVPTFFVPSPIACAVERPGASDPGTLTTGCGMILAVGGNDPRISNLSRKVFTWSGSQAYGTVNGTWQFTSGATVWTHTFNATRDRNVMTGTMTFSHTTIPFNYQLSFVARRLP